jgi:hypothetical protein
MKNVRVGLPLVAVLAASASAGTLGFLNTPTTVVDRAVWSGIGPDQTAFSNGQTVNSVLGNTVTIGLGTQPALGGITSVVCDPITPVNCSWASQPSGYHTNDTLLWLEGLDTNGNPVGTGPLTLSLLNAVGGLGLYIQTTAVGAFSATLNVFNGLTLLGSHSYSSDTSGDPLFVGAQDSVREINRIVVTVNTCGSFACDANDFSADTLQIFSNTPEPGTFALGTALLAAIGLRKRFGKGGNKR